MMKKESGERSPTPLAAPGLNHAESAVQPSFFRRFAV